MHEGTGLAYLTATFFLPLKYKYSTRWWAEEDSTEKRLIMDKFRGWAPLFKAVDTENLLVRLVGVREEIFSCGGGGRVRF